MSVDSTRDLLVPGTAVPAGGRALPARLWLRIPVVVRAIVVGLFVLVGGNFLPQGLIGANFTSPAVPWSAVLIAGYLWLYWRYVGGRWWPASTSESRRRDLRAAPLSAQLWGWSLVAGISGIAALTTLSYTLARLLPLGLGLPDALLNLPPLTLVTIVVTISVMAGIVEEAAFRGYMQGRIERRHGPVAAILVVSIVFALAHFPTSLAAIPRMCLILIASTGYGILAYLTRSILPGVILHAAGDIFSFGLLWLSVRGAAVPSHAPTRGLSNPMFWVNGLETIVLAILTVWAFRRLAAAARAERRKPA